MNNKEKAEEYKINSNEKTKEYKNIFYTFNFEKEGKEEQQRRKSQFVNFSKKEKV